MGALRFTREDGRAWSTTSATPSSMRANERGGFCQTRLAKFVDRRAREFSEVAVAEGVQGGPGLLRGA